MAVGYNELLFSVRLSVRYHERRQRFMANVLNFTLWWSLVMGSASTAAILGAVSDLWKVLPVLLLTVLSAGCLAYGVRARAALHDDLRRRFIALEAELREKGESHETAQQGEIDRLRIELDEPPILRVLACICHNAESRSMGIPSGEWARISPVQRFLSPFFDWRPNTIKLPEASEAEAAA